MKSTVIIAGFPGIGKSHLFKEKMKDKIILDSDSSMFSKLEDGEHNPDFPLNYIKHIKENIGVADIILVSTHEQVRRLLEKEYILYNIVYPSIELKEEYIDRYKNRNNTEEFISILDKMWDNWIRDIECEKFPYLYKLNQGEYLGDVINQMK